MENVQGQYPSSGVSSQPHTKGNTLQTFNTHTMEAQRHATNPNDFTKKQFSHASPDIRKRNNEVAKAYVKGSTLRKKESN